MPLHVGALVKFSWWSSYKAPSLYHDDAGHATWHELKPGDTGVVMSYLNEVEVIVLFSNVDTLLKIHTSMLVVV
jgi:hypothetical protein